MCLKDLKRKILNFAIYFVKHLWEKRAESKRDVPFGRIEMARKEK
jgi:hypothetical protein